MIFDKAALRREMRAERARFAAAHPEPIPVPDGFLERIRPGQVLASYVPIGGEADPALLVSAAREVGLTIVLPHVLDRATPLRFLECVVDAELVEGPFNLRQPAATCREVAPDIVLTPLVAFDHRLDRLGQGAGHYDRAFARYPEAWRVGVAWSVQEVPAIPADIWDMPLHAVVTERGMIAHHEGSTR